LSADDVVSRHVRTAGLRLNDDESIVYSNDHARGHRPSRPLPPVRVGIGFDVHRLEVGRRLVLAGLELPWDMGLLGHSDGDVICHALIDALCGAAALGDIGTLFPDSDPKYKDARSLDLLRDAGGRCRAAGWTVGNADVTLIAQVPKLAPYRDEMRKNLASALGVEPAAVGLKATTTDHLGVIGRGEGLAAQAVVLLRPSV